MMLSDGTVHRNALHGGARCASAETAPGGCYRYPARLESSPVSTEGELVVDGGGITFVSSGPGEEQFWDFCDLVSWCADRGDRVFLCVGCGNNVEEFSFQARRGDSGRILTGIKAYVASILSVRDREQQKLCETKQSVQSWLLGCNDALAVGEGEAAPAAIGGVSSPGRRTGVLKRRPGALKLPRGSTAGSPEKINSDGSVSTASDTMTGTIDGISTPERELAVAMRAAALVQEDYSPRTAKLKLSEFELNVRHKAAAPARMAEQAKRRDEARMMERATRSAHIAQQAVEFGTPSRIHAAQQMEDWAISHNQQQEGKEDERQHQHQRQQHQQQKEEWLRTLPQEDSCRMPAVEEAKLTQVLLPMPVLDGIQVVNSEQVHEETRHLSATQLSVATHSMMTPAIDNGNNIGAPPIFALGSENVDFEV